MEQLIHSGADPLSSLREQHDFNQAKGTDANGLSAMVGVIKHPALPARQFLGIRDPADHDVGIEQKSRIQEAVSSIAPERIPQVRSIEIDNISGDFELPCQNIFRRSPRRLLRRGNRGYRPSTLGHRNRAPLLLNFVEQCETFGLELGSADDAVLHKFRIPYGHLTSSPALPQALSGVVDPSSACT